MVVPKDYMRERSLQFISALQQVSRSMGRSGHLYLSQSSGAFCIATQKTCACSFRTILLAAAEIKNSHTISWAEQESLMASFRVITTSFSKKERSGLFRWLKNILIGQANAILAEHDLLRAEKERYKACVAQRKGSLAEELKRAESLVPHSVQRVIERFTDDASKLDQLKVSLARALEIKRLYQDTHYVFTHATTAASTACFCLIKEFMRARTGFRTALPFKCFRPLLGKHVSVDKFLQVNPYLVKGILTDHAFSQDLLSMDGYIWSDRRLGESALDMLQYNRSVMVAGGRTYAIPGEVIDMIFKHFNVPVAKFAELKASLDLIVEDYQLRMLPEANQQAEYGNLVQKNLIGDLYVICVKKSVVNARTRTPVYASKFNGVPIHGAYTGKKMVKELEKLQKAPVFREKLPKETGYSQYQLVPQYRCLAPCLRPEEVRSFCITPASRPVYKTMKSAIRELVVRQL